MPSYKLTYFNVRGLGEVSRLLFALADQEYVDDRIEFKQWGPKAKKNTPFDQLPILEMDGKQYCQSSAIYRYLAKKFGMYGQDNLEALEIDQALGIGQDIMNTVSKVRFEKDEARKAEYKKEMDEVKMPQYLGMWEKILKGKGNGHFVGGKITLADVFLFDLCEKLDEYVDFFKYPSIKACREAVGKEPKIKAWVEKRPKTDI